MYRPDLNRFLAGGVGLYICSVQFCVDENYQGGIVQVSKLQAIFVRLREGDRVDRPYARWWLFLMEHRPKGGVGLFVCWCGACLEAARAYEGVWLVEDVLEKVNLLVGMVTARFISARLSANLLSFFEMISGTVHPNAFDPASALANWLSSSLSQKGLRLMEGNGWLARDSARSRKWAAKVLMLAADSEPIVIFSAPFLGNLIALSMMSCSLRDTSRMPGALGLSWKRFLNPVERGVPR